MSFYKNTKNVFQDGRAQGFYVADSMLQDGGAHGT